MLAAHMGVGSNSQLHMQLQQELVTAGFSFTKVYRCKAGKHQLVNIACYLAQTVLLNIHSMF